LILATVDSTLDAHFRVQTISPYSTLHINRGPPVFAMPRTTRTSAKAAGLEMDPIESRQQDVAVRKMTPSEIKKAAGLTDAQIQENQKKLRQFQRLLSGLETESPDFVFKGKVTREFLLNIIKRDPCGDFVVDTARNLAPLTRKDGKQIIDTETINTNWLQYPRSFLASWTYMVKRADELDRLAKDKEGKARIDALSQTRVGDATRVKKRSRETTLDDKTADETVMDQAIVTAPQQPAGQAWRDHGELSKTGSDLVERSGGEEPTVFPQSNLQHDSFDPPTSPFQTWEPEAEPRRLSAWEAGTEAVPSTSKLIWNSSRDIEATMPSPKLPFHWKDDFAPSRSNRREGLREPSTSSGDRHQGSLHRREPPNLLVHSSTFANRGMGEPANLFAASPESNGYLTYKSPPKRAQFPIPEEPQHSTSVEKPQARVDSFLRQGSQDLTPIEGPPACGAVGTLARREKRRFTGEWYQWWLQRHRETYGSGSRRSGFRPLGGEGDESHESHAKSRHDRKDTGV